MFGANPTQHITMYLSSYFQAWWWLHHVMCMCQVLHKWLQGSQAQESRYWVANGAFYLGEPKAHGTMNTKYNTG
jgi:hypothetical protein